MTAGILCFKQRNDVVLDLLNLKPSNNERYLPTQLVPSPRNPSRQMHLYEPTVSWQVALNGHTIVRHSFLSIRWNWRAWSRLLLGKNNVNNSVEFMALLTQWSTPHCPLPSPPQSTIGFDWLLPMHLCSTGLFIAHLFVRKIKSWLCNIRGLI